MEGLLEFFVAWDSLESMHPFGITRFASLFSQFGISEHMCSVVDECLFLDLMYSQRSRVRRIKVEHRTTRAVVWAYVDFSDGVASVAFQSSPNARFEYSVHVALSPSGVVGGILAYFGTQAPCQRCVLQGVKRRRVE